MNRFFDEVFRKLFGVANRCRGKDELWIGSIKARHTFETSDYVGNMRTEDATIGMRFVNDHKAQTGEEIAPVGVMRQDACMEHIGIAQYDMSIFTNRGAGRLRRIAVINR